MSPSRPATSQPAAGQPAGQPARPNCSQTFSQGTFRKRHNFFHKVITNRLLFPQIQLGPILAPSGLLPDQPASQPASQPPASQPASQRAGRPAGQPASQSASKPQPAAASHPDSQPATASHSQPGSLGNYNMGPQWEAARFLAEPQCEACI